MTDLPEPKNQTEALAQALTLAIVAPTEDKAQQAVTLAEQLSAGLPELEVARAKKLAQGMAKEWEDEQ